MYFKSFWILVALASYAAAVMGLPEVIKVGGLFDSEDSDVIDAFHEAINRINTDDSILSKSKLKARVEILRPHSSFQASKIVCRMLDEGVAAIFGPYSPSSSAVVESTCELFNFPHLEGNWKYRENTNVRTINFYPDAATLSKAYVDVIRNKGWKSFTVVYEDNEDLIRLQDVLKASTEKRYVKVTLKQLNPEQSYRKLIKDIGKTGETNVVLDIPIDKVIPVLKEAANVKMLTEYNNYFVPSLDFHTLPFEELAGVLSNVTGLRLVDPENPIVMDVIRDRVFSQLQHGQKAREKQQITTNAALVYDALYMFAQTLNDLDRSQEISLGSFSCSNPQPWAFGNSVINYLRMTNMEGLSGLIEFDEMGKRTNFQLDLVDFKRDSLVKVGWWSPETNVNITQDYSKTYDDVIHSLENRTLRVTTLVNSPYTIMKPDSENLTGNARFEGYNIDLLEEISKILKFKYEVNEVKDTQYGSKLANGEWNGMMKEVIAREADIAVADLTITSGRADAVDFAMPHLTLGITILFKKPEETPPNIFSFLSPFSLDVWFYMATAYLGISLFLYFLARFTPYEWVNPHPCEEEAEELENQFNLQNSLWFTIGALMQQGSDLAPRAMTTRLLGLFWYFFTLIMIATYTANLAAFLTAGMMSTPIENANDLAKQNKIQYGCVKAGSTYSFFKNNKNEPFKRMWSTMESARPEVFTNGNTKGIERVLKGNYAFLMESTTIEYQTERDCRLSIIGGLLDNKGYGIATPLGSPYRVPISRAIINLQEGGILHMLKMKWWKGQGGGICDTDTKPAATQDLGIANVGGVFIVLGFGVVLAIFIVIGEFVWKTHKIPREFRDAMCVEFYKELKFVLTYRGSERPIPKSESASFTESVKMLPLKINTANNVINRMT